VKHFNLTLLPTNLLTWLHILLRFSTFFKMALPHCTISDFRREVDENCALLGYYSASSGNFLPTFFSRDNLSVRNYHHSLRNNPE
jgi:hypothetical protein